MSDNSKGTIFAHYSEISKEKLHKWHLNLGRTIENSWNWMKRVRLGLHQLRLMKLEKKKTLMFLIICHMHLGISMQMDCCGAMSHNAMSCTERPRKVGAKWTNKNIAPDEKIENSQLDYDAKHDLWNAVKKLEEKNSNHIEEDNEDALKVDEAKVDDSKQMDFAKVEKRICTAGGGSTGTVRNLLIREDITNYLPNLDVNSAHYDPKTRSMSEDPLPATDPNEKFYPVSDNYDRATGEALELKQLNIHAWAAFEKGHDIHIQAAPSQAQLLYENYKINQEKLKSQKESVMEKYGSDEVLP
ncbi:hypothetical protein CsSME_00020312 [Camellia sinensis var. sinensis]